VSIKGCTEAAQDQFTETKELIGGYWMLQAKSIDEVVEWMKRFPLDKNGGELEIRDLAPACSTSRCNSGEYLGGFHPSKRLSASYAVL
jgi:hypothetical protein